MAVVVARGAATPTRAAVSGMIAGPNCPHVVKGWFIPGKSPIAACDVQTLARNPANCRLAWLRWSTTAGLMTEQNPATSSLQLKIATLPSTHEKICASWPSVYFTEPLALSLHCAIHQPMVCGQLAKQAVAATNLLAGALGQPVNGSVITSW